jgi:hypothetical protein
MSPASTFEIALVVSATRAMSFTCPKSNMVGPPAHVENAWKFGEGAIGSTLSLRKRCGRSTECAAIGASTCGVERQEQFLPQLVDDEGLAKHRLILKLLRQPRTPVTRAEDKRNAAPAQDVRYRKDKLASDIDV